MNANEAFVAWSQSTVISPENDMAIIHRAFLAGRESLVPVVRELAKVLGDVRVWMDLNRCGGSVLYDPVCDALAKAEKVVQP